MTKQSGAKLFRFLVPAGLSVVGIFAASLSSNVATAAARPLGMTAKITPAAFAMPDLTLIGTLKIGKDRNTLKSVDWGGIVTLTPADSSNVAGDGSAAFRICYTISEKNGVAASGFGPKNNQLGDRQSRGDPE